MILQSINLLYIVDKLMKMDKDMDMVEKFMLMGLFMKGVIVKIVGKVMEGVFRVILVIILENGKIIINMDMV